MFDDFNITIQSDEFLYEEDYDLLDLNAYPDEEEVRGRDDNMKILQIMKF